METKKFIDGRTDRRTFFKRAYKNVGGVTVVNLCMSSGHVYICAKFREIISNGIKIRERTQMINR